MTLAIPSVFPQVLSILETAAFSTEPGEITGTSGFLLQFEPDPETGSTFFPSLQTDDTVRDVLLPIRTRLVDGTTDSCKLSVLAITLDAWRIIHHLVVDSEVSRDEIFGKMKRHEEINHPLRTTHGEWTLRDYCPNLCHLEALAGSVFSDGEDVPPLTGRVGLTHLSGRMINVSSEPLGVPPGEIDFSMRLEIGWAQEETASAQMRLLADGRGRVVTEGYTFRFTGQSLQGLITFLGIEGSSLAGVAAEISAAINQGVETVVDRVALTVTLNNGQADRSPLMPLSRPARSLLWDPAVRHIIRRTHN